MKLPAALTPWAKFLQIFPEEISLALGGYVQKISPFINSLNAQDDLSKGEPNGYDGVARRGIYERLLLSELALADEMSDEFIRRAVMGEHLFLQLAEMSPNAKRVSVALFDAGALQIGTPRIAHLATFIVLARRAEAARAMFLWGVLQDAQQLIIADDTEASIKILLESRTPFEVTQADLRAWREKLSELDKMADIWLVGSPQLAQFEETKGFSHLFVDEVVELDKREITLSVKSASHIEKQTTLELPPPDVCTRLLRNPFDQPKRVEFTAGALGGKVKNFFFDPLGEKLFARLDSDDVLCFSVQNLPGGDKIYPTVYKPRDSTKYLAAGRLRRAIAFVSAVDHHTLRFEYRKSGFGLKAGSYKVVSGEIALWPGKENGLLQIFNLRPKRFPYDEAGILDAERNLFLLNQASDGDQNSQGGTARLIATDVLAIAQTGQEFLFVGCEDGNSHHRIVSIGDKIERRELPVTKCRRAFFGRGELGKKALAVESESGEWSILTDEEKPLALRAAPKGEVVGVYQDSRLAPTAGLFELLDDRRTLEFSWRGGGRRKIILKSGDEIAKIEFSPRSPLLAYQTVGGELVFFSITYRREIGRYSR